MVVEQPGLQGLAAGLPYATLGIYGQRYTAAGAKSGAEFRINTRTIDDQSLPAVAALKNGGFVVAWTSKGQDGSGLGVYAQRFDNAANATGERSSRSTPRPRTISPRRRSRRSPAAALSSSGSPMRRTARVSAFTGSAMTLSRKPPARSSRSTPTTAEDQSLPSVAGLNDGGFVVAWQSDEQDRSGLGIYAQRFTAAGARPGTELLHQHRGAGSQSQPSVAAFAEAAASS